MLDFAFIAPLARSEYSSQGRIEMVLAQHLDDPVYLELIKEKAKTKRIYLDNGAHEGEFKGVEWFIDKIKQVRPFLVFAPDQLKDFAGTQELTLKFLKELTFTFEGKHPFLVAGIPQGNTIDEYRDSLDFFNDRKDIDWLGLSYIAANAAYPSVKMHEARERILIEEDIRKPTQLLGMSDGFNDLYKGSAMDNVKSCDSSSPFMSGYLDILYKKNEELKEKTQTTNFDIKNLTEKQKNVIQKNINFIKKELTL